MKLLGFGHLSIFSIDKCRPDSIKRETYIDKLENSFHKKSISTNFQNSHNLEIYSHNYRIEIVSYSNPTIALKCESDCFEMFSDLLAHADVIHSSSFTVEFFDSLCKIFNLKISENNSISIPTLNKKNSIILKYALESRAFNLSLGSAGLNSIALYVNEIDICLLNNLGFTPVTDTMNLKINDFNYEIVFLNLDGVLVELLRRYK